MRHRSKNAVENGFTTFVLQSILWSMCVYRDRKNTSEKIHPQNQKVWAQKNPANSEKFMNLWRGERNHV